MKLMSFNTQHCLNYLEKRIDFELIARTITDCGADIVGLNEMRGLGSHPEYTAQTEMLAKLTGMQYYYFAPAIELNAGPYGNAILSKYPILSAEAVAIPDPQEKIYTRHYETRCVLKAQIEGGLTVLVTHFGLNTDEQVNAVKTVVSNLSEKCVLMGDFNVTPDNPVISPIRERMKDAADLFENEKLSFPSDEPTRKIDYIFLSPDIKLMSADIPAIVASDHRPHLATVAM